MHKIDIGIVCAINEEFSALTLHLEEIEHQTIAEKSICVGISCGLRVGVIQSGVGNIHAAAASTLLIIKMRPEVMLFSGVAGSLDPNFSIGDVIIGEASFQAEALSHEQLRASWDMPPLMKHADSLLLSQALALGANSSYPIRSGVIVSSDIYPAPKDYELLFSEHAAGAIDMETAAFYQTCLSFSIPCLCIRSISNPVTNSDYEPLLDEHINTSSTHSSEVCFRLVSSISSQENVRFTPALSDVEKLIKTFSLVPHVEGGHYQRVHQSAQLVGVDLSEYSSDVRHAGTSIYYLLAGPEFSAWHRIKSDETWYHHQGCSITIHMIDAETNAYTTEIVGDHLNKGAGFQYTVKRNTWFAVSLNDPLSYALCGCAVSPGFDCQDFELAGRLSLISSFPEHAAIIERYTKHLNH